MRLVQKCTKGTCVNLYKETTCKSITVKHVWKTSLPTQEVFCRFSWGQDNGIHCILLQMSHFFCGASKSFSSGLYHLFLANKWCFERIKRKCFFVKYFDFNSSSFARFQERCYLWKTIFPVHPLKHFQRICVEGGAAVLTFDLNINQL